MLAAHPARRGQPGPQLTVGERDHERKQVVDVLGAKLRLVFLCQRRDLLAGGQRGAGSEVELLEQAVRERAAQPGVDPSGLLGELGRNGLLGKA